MARAVREIMNPELFTLRPEESAMKALDALLALEISAAPVVDGDWRPIGVLSIRDVFDPTRFGDKVGDRMSSPAAVVRDDANIDDAARLLGETRYRHLIAIDERGATTGVVSAVDLVRALVGLPARRPRSFPHFDVETGLVWTDDTKLDLDHVLESAPPAPGCFQLIYGGVMIPERIVWSEESLNVRGRLVDLLAAPAEQPAMLRVWIERGLPNMRFRATRSVAVT